MSLIRYNPFNELHNDINRVFRAWNDVESAGATAAWVPSADVLELNDRFEIYVDLPGVAAADVDVTIEKGVLSVTGERKRAEDVKDVVNYRKERGHGRFHRRFVLPDRVDAEGVKATGRDGVLEISIPKHAQALPRRIQVAA
jgi:HSP20 family protein